MIPKILILRTVPLILVFGTFDLNRNQCNCETTAIEHPIKSESYDAINPNLELAFVASLFYRGFKGDDGQMIEESTYNDTKQLELQLSPLCVGVILTTDFVLTARTCLDDSKDDYNFRHLHIGAGLDQSYDKIWRSKDNFRKMKQVFKHPGYKQYESETGQAYSMEDLALIKVVEPFKFNNQTGIYPPCLLNNEEFDEFDDLIVAGYSVSETLLTNKSDTKTDNHSSKEAKFTYTTINRTKEGGRMCRGIRSICAFNDDSRPCLGDLGMPLLVRNANGVALIGISSVIGGNTTNTDTCQTGSTTRFNTIYTNLVWIKVHAGDQLCLTALANSSTTTSSSKVDNITDKTTIESTVPTNTSSITEAESTTETGSIGRLSSTGETTVHLTTATGNATESSTTKSINHTLTSVNPNTESTNQTSNQTDGQLTEITKSSSPTVISTETTAYQTTINLANETVKLTSRPTDQNTITTESIRSANETTNTTSERVFTTTETANRTDVKIDSTTSRTTEGTITTGRISPITDIHPNVTSPTTNSSYSTSEDYITTREPSTGDIRTKFSPTTNNQSVNPSAKLSSQTILTDELAINQLFEVLIIAISGIAVCSSVVFILIIALRRRMD